MVVGDFGELSGIGVVGCRTGNELFGYEDVGVRNGVWDRFRGGGRTGGEKRELPDIPVVSSYLGVVGYDSDRSRLLVEFTDGVLIEYRGVPEGEFRDLLDADSNGQYFYYNIRDVYPWRKLRG